MIEAFIYPVPEGEEYEAPRTRDCHGATRLATGDRHGPLRGPRDDSTPSPCPLPLKRGRGQ